MREMELNTGVNILVDVHMIWNVTESKTENLTPIPYFGKADETKSKVLPHYISLLNSGYTFLLHKVTELSL